MIIDADVHISPTAELGSISIDELLRRMDRAGVDKAVTWLQPPYRRDIDDGNAYVFSASRMHPDRVLGFGWADPNLGVDRARATVKRCVDEYGFFGVKLNGAQNGFFVDDPRLSIPVIEEIAKRGTRLALHVGVDAFEHTHPFRVAKIARLFPELPILMVHMGGVAFHDMSSAAIEVAKEYPNITLIGSAVRTNSVLNAVYSLGFERVCYGSDTPFEPMHVEVARYRAMLDGEVSDEARRAVMGGNIQRLFGISE